MKTFDPFNPTDRADSEIKLTSLSMEEVEIRKKLDFYTKRLEEIRREKEMLLPPVEEEVSLDVPELQVTEGTVNKDSPLSQKTKLYRSFFRGRTDVYATRTKLKTTGKVIYSPKCKNFWLLGACGKREQIKDACKNCPNKNYERLSDAILEEQHFRNQSPEGIGGIGIYPMLPDDICYFLAFDFDDDGYEKNALSVAGVARRNGFDAVIERSRSGEGAHVWIFFENAIKASKVRRFGFLLMSLASEENKGLDMSSFDRLFPNQDRLPEGGFGNLILLPFLYSAMQNGNTVFVDNSFHPYPNQWSVLESIRKVKESAVDAFLNTKTKSIPFDLVSVDEVKDRTVNLEPGKDCRGELVLYLSSGISIDTAFLSPRAVQVFRRLASFSNPEYFSRQRLGKYLDGKTAPRYISLSEERNGILWLPIGLKGDLEDILSSNHIPYRVEDHRTKRSSVKFSFQGTLRSDQLEAVEAFRKYGSGVIAAATGFGKTVVASSLIAEYGGPVLVLVPNLTLVAQWKKALVQFLGDTVHIGEQTKKKAFQRGQIDVMNIQSLLGRKKDENSWKAPDYLKEYSFIIIDECHHASTESFRLILENCRPAHLLGLSATVKREDGMELSTRMYLGPIVYKETAKHLNYVRGIAIYLHPRFVPLSISLPKEDVPLAEVLNLLCSDSLRNEMIVKDIAKAFDDKRTPLVLTHRVEEVHVLNRLLEEKGIPAIAVTGKQKGKEKKERDKKLSLLSTSRVVVIATGKTLGEGFDLPSLDTLFLATPCAWEGVVEQYVGRITREQEGKDRAIIYDYIDSGIRVCASMYRKRQKAYAKLGCIMLTGNTAASEESTIFVDSRFSMRLEEDLRNAKESVFISSLKGDSSRISELESLVQDTCKLRMETSDKSLSDTPWWNPGCYQDYVIIDSSIVWYGNASPLARRANGSMLRFLDRQLARTLTEESTRLPGLGL